MYIRDDVTGSQPVPRHIEDLLLRIGGRNPHGEPMHRIIMAECRTTKLGGVATTWRENASLRERGGMVAVQTDRGVVAMQSQEKPIRVTSGIRVAPYYDSSLRGFVLERWFPPMFSQAEWYQPAMLDVDGTPVNGPYPEYGEFLKLADPTAEIPSPDEIMEHIQLFEYSLEVRRRLAPKQRLVEMYNWRAHQEKQAEEKRKNETYLYLKDKFAFMKGSSLEAGREREALANRVREKGGQISHIGN